MGNSSAVYPDLLTHPHSSCAGASDGIKMKVDSFNDRLAVNLLDCSVGQVILCRLLECFPGQPWQLTTYSAVTSQSKLSC